MAGGELPDIVVFHSRQQAEEAVKADMLVNLDEHLDKLPNLVKYAKTAMQYYRDTASNGTGKLYAATTFVGPVEEAKEPNWGPYLRWDLYKKLGMPVVNELEDYLPLVKQMQDMEPKTKDGQKTYGFSLWKDWDTFGMANAMDTSVLNGIDTGETKSVIWDLDANGVPAITEQGWDIIDNLKDLPGGGKLTDAFNIIGVQGLTGTVIDPTTKAPNDTEFQKYIDDMTKKADILGIQKLLDVDLTNWQKANEDAKKYDN
ncbi:unnamed protein product [Aphanomyces euteiches]